MMIPLHRHADWALLILRLVVGAIFLYHGYAKWGMETPNTIMSILKFAEPLAGIALILGVLTQLAALGLAIIMAGAIYMKATGFGSSALDLAGTFAPQGSTGWEFDLVLLASAIVLLFMGAGKFSLDAMIFKPKTV